MRWRLLIGGMVLAAALPTAAQAAQPAPEVVAVQPSGAEVPTNLLRLSVVFAAPIEGAVLPRIALSHADGRLLQEPFLQQELWSPDGKVLTLLFHPGRVKTGLIAREQQGPILSEGEDVVLSFDGRPIKRWHIGPVDGNGPVAAAWKLSTVRPGTREPFMVSLDGPIDGRDAGYLAVVDAGDHLVEGERQLRNGETMWTFTPDSPWKAGVYRLMVHGTLEDPSGNRLGGHFETSIDSPQRAAADVTLDFKVSSN